LTLPFFVRRFLGQFPFNLHRLQAEEL